MNDELEEQLRQLRADQQSFEVLFDASPVPLILSRGRDQIVLTINQAASSLFEVPVETALGRKAIDYWVDPDDRARVLHEIKTKGRADGVEAQLRTTSGRLFWAIVSATPVTYLGEQMVLIACRDITEKRFVEETLRAAQRSFEALFEASPMPLILSRAKDQTVITGNEAASRLFEVSKSEADGLRALDYWVDPAERAKVLTEVRTKGRAEGIEARLRARSGRVFWALVSATPVAYMGELAILVSCPDITAKKVQEDRLRAEHQMLGAILAATPVPMVVTGLEDSIVKFANAKAAEFFETSLDQFIGKRAPDFYSSPSDRVSFVDALRRDKVVDGFVARLKTAAGRESWASLAARAFSLNGEEVFAVGFTDLTEQRMMLEAVLDSMVDGVLIVDAAGRIRRANDALARLLGTTSAKLAGRTVAEVLDPSEEGFASTLVPSVSEGPFQGREVSFRAADGARITVTVNGSPHRDRQGALVGVVLVARDERELRKAQAQLQISDRMATMGTLAAGVAHEINNPLAFNIANLEFGVETLQAWKDHGVKSGEVDELLAALTSAVGGAERVRHIVRDLKSFTRVDEDSLSNVDLNRLLDTTTTMLRAELKHRARLEKQYGTPPPIAANEARVVQVFLNLIQNAAHAIAPGNVNGNAVRIQTGSDASGNAVVEITDTGCGIASEHLSRIFDPFFTTKPVGVGTGLGLAICQRIVAGLGGSIVVESRIGQGTTFRVTLPAGAAEAAASSRVPSPRRASARRSVLVVDDEIEIGEAVKRVLGGEHDVVAVSEAREALALLATRHFDVILCDVLMPEMTGPELYARLRAEMPDLARRVIFVTGGTFPPDGSFADIPNETLAKPFDTRELREIVARVAAGET